ncbi:hypothetical protein ACFYZE_15430 [Streptomyces sp. NPDC001796]|uniref:hypothetical protein n=1 Tax=Streptomyces sp. NPDC001796 TaxID=3364609 RepID=UPI0036A2FFD6
MTTHAHPAFPTEKPSPSVVPAGPRLAAAGPGGGRGTKGAGRQAVLSALRSDPHPAHGADDPTPERPGIRIYAPPVYRSHDDGARWSKRYSGTPTAAYACTCGQTATVTGQHAVAALAAEYDAHKYACTGAPALHTERRNAA